MTTPETSNAISRIAKLRNIIAENERSLFEMRARKTTTRKIRCTPRTPMGRIFLNLP